jgi:hypothetical protein
MTGIFQCQSHFHRIPESSFGLVGQRVAGGAGSQFACGRNVRSAGGPTVPEKPAHEKTLRGIVVKDRAEARIGRLWGVTAPE